MANYFSQTVMQSFLRPYNLLQLFLFSLFLFLLGDFLYSGAEASGYNWQWFRVPRYLYIYDATGFVAGPLLQGLLVTLQITACSLVLSLVTGLIVALLRLLPDCSRIIMKLTRRFEEKRP